MPSLCGVCETGCTSVISAFHYDAMPFTPTHADKFTFGLWTVGNPARSFRGTHASAPGPVEIVHRLAPLGAWGVNLHDNDLVPIDDRPPTATASSQSSDSARGDGSASRWAPRQSGSAPGAFVTVHSQSSDAAVRAYALQEDHERNWTGGGNWEPARTSSGRTAKGRRVDAGKGFHRGDQVVCEAMNYPCEYAIDQNYAVAVCVEASRTSAGDIYFPTTGAYLGFIETLDHRRWWASIRRWRTSTWPG